MVDKRDELVGLVRSMMYGKHNDMLQNAIDIANKLAEIDGVPVNIVNNRLTTAMQTMFIFNKVMGKK